MRRAVVAAFALSWLVAGPAGRDRAVGASVGPAARRPAVEPPTLVVPKTAPVGEDLVVGVTGADNTQLHVDQPMGQVVAAVIDGRAEIPGSALTTAGVVLLWVDGPGGRTTATFDLLPGKPTRPTEVWVGQRTVVADGRDLAMAVATPLDGFGNVASGELTALLRGPGDASSQVAVKRTGLVSWVDLVSTTRAGIRSVQFLTTDGGGAPGATPAPPSDLVQVAGPPVALTLTVDSAGVSADGRSLVEVGTGLLIDEFGNTLSDGTAVSVRAESNAGAWERTLPVLGGRAHGVMEAPDLPTTVTYTASTVGRVSLPVTVTFGPAVRSVPVQVDRAGFVEVGPVGDPSGGVVADGTPVTAAFLDGDGKVLDQQHGYLDGGRWVAPALAPPGAKGVIVEVLGVWGQVQL